MALAETAPAPENAPTTGYIGRIPVGNLWLLMLYASDLFKIKGRGMVEREDAPDDLPDLVAEVLAHAVEERQRRRLNHSYRTRAAVLNRVRGRIDMLKTERRQLLARGLVACTFDELTVDTPRNRFVRAALEKAARIVRDADLAHRCRSLAHQMAAMGVSSPAPGLREISTERFGHYDANDRHMVAAAKLLFEMAIPAEKSGFNVLPLPNREKRWVWNLFERAVYGFCEVALSPKGWRTERNTLKWQTSGETSGINSILPNMQTDITLNERNTGRRIIIDTKFTDALAQGQYRETLKSGHIYQIYAYLRSQEGLSAAADKAEGLLLYPSTGENVYESAVIQNHCIRFMTVDLTRPAEEIRAQLMKVIDSK